MAVNAAARAWPELSVTPAPDVAQVTPLSANVALLRVNTVRAGASFEATFTRGCADPRYYEIQKHERSNECYLLEQNTTRKFVSRFGLAVEH